MDVSSSTIAVTQTVWLETPLYPKKQKNKKQNKQTTTKNPKKQIKQIKQKQQQPLFNPYYYIF